MIHIVTDFSKKEAKEGLWKVLKTLKKTKYVIDIKQYRENRSNPQNRYYWGVVIDILSAHTGFTPDEMHFELKRRFLPVFKPLPTGEEVRLPGSTATLDTLKFEEYLENIKRFAIQELECYMPDPNETI
jgi:hypothetical protein